jgi:hypothetical protein
VKEIQVGAKGEFALVIQPGHLANRFRTRLARHLDAKRN